MTDQRSAFRFRVPRLRPSVPPPRPATNPTQTPSRRPPVRPQPTPTPPSPQPQPLPPPPVVFEIEQRMKEPSLLNKRLLDKKACEWCLVLMDGKTVLCLHQLLMEVLLHQLLMETVALVKEPDRNGLQGGKPVLLLLSGRFFCRRNWRNRATVPDYAYKYQAISLVLLTHSHSYLSYKLIIISFSVLDSFIHHL
ncbi:hypothetical protein Tco_1549231 [Tanacetum coccineum]